MLRCCCVFPCTTEKCFEPLFYQHLLNWIDDLLLMATDIESYLVKFVEFFDLVAIFGLKLSVRKSSLYQRMVKWCGRIIDSDGVSHDSNRV
jgi:hypothetical protein